MNWPVFVAIRVDIAPDVRIDSGGGEIGEFEVLGVANKWEDAVTLTRTDSDKLLKEIELEQDTFEEMVDSHEYNYSYRVAQTELI